jgi:GMP synthase-like glutamine amidotransferase
MNIGILLCDQVEEELRATHGGYADMYIRLLSQVNAKLTFIEYDAELGELPEHVDACDAYLITGSRHGVNDLLAWIAPLEYFIRQLHAKQKKVIGICFGHQLIAKALGGKVIKSPKGWGIGMAVNRIVQKKPWMFPEHEVVNVLVSHQDQVIELPYSTEVLASNEFCPFYMLQIGHNIFTIQGHPEFSKAYSRALIENRKNALDKVCYEQGLASLQLAVHDTIIAQWINNFLSL